MPRGNGYYQTDAGDGPAEQAESWMGSAALGVLSEEMTPAERADVIKDGAAFAKAAGEESEKAAREESEALAQEETAEEVEGAGGDTPCLFISGQLGYYKGDERHLLFENRVKRSCLAAFGHYPPQDEKARIPGINLLLDSTGGVLDSAFKIILYLSGYAKMLDVYVPRRAKSASTLIALGASHVFLSPFGELGPLDTQIDDPRFAKKSVSALDCYQSVDYVRSFGFNTIEEGLETLIKKAGKQMSSAELLQRAADFAVGAVMPMMNDVKALDFGGWGRSLMIGERYTRILLQRVTPDKERAERIARRLVYGYTHHPFPIDLVEALDVGLPARLMGDDACRKADHMVELCGNDKAFVGFISEKEAAAEASAPPITPRVTSIGGRRVAAGGRRRQDTPAVANVPTPTNGDTPAVASVRTPVDDDD